MAIDKARLEKLYYVDGFSMSEIAQKLDITVWQIVSFMRKNNLKRRTSADTQKLQFEKKPLSFDFKIDMTDKENRLWRAGIMLYWAEGSKVGKQSTVDLANCNEHIITIFLQMLRKIYRVNEDRLRFFLYSYSNQNQNQLIDYWSNLLNVSKNQFTRPYVRKDFKQNKVFKMPKGLIHVRYNDKKLFKKILEDIDIISKEFIN